MRLRWLALVAPLLAPLAASGVTLKYKYRDGAVARYQETFRGTGAMKVAFGGDEQSLPIQMSSRDERTLTPSAPAADGSAWVRSKSDGAEIDLNVLGQQQRERGPATDFRLRMNAQGDVLEIDEAAATPAQGDSMVRMTLAGAMQNIGLLGFPDGDVRVGATWNREVPVRTATGRMTARAASTLKDIQVTDDGIQATIETRFSIPIPKSQGSFTVQGMQLPIAMEGTYEGTSTTIWDVVAGRAVSTDSRGTMKLTLSLAGGFGGAIDSAAVELQTEVATKLLEE